MQDQRNVVVQPKDNKTYSFQIIARLLQVAEAYWVVQGLLKSDST